MDLKTTTNPITSFCGRTIQPMGSIELEVEFGNCNIKKNVILRSLFNIVDTRLAYNGVIGRPILWKLVAITSIRYLVMKILILKKIITIKRDQEVAKQCYNLAIKDELKAFPIEHFIKIEKHGVNLEPVDELQELKLANGKTIKISGEAPSQIKKEIIKVL